MKKAIKENIEMATYIAEIISEKANLRELPPVVPIERRYLVTHSYLSRLEIRKNLKNDTIRVYFNSEVTKRMGFPTFRKFLLFLFGEEGIHRRPPKYLYLEKNKNSNYFFTLNHKRHD